MPFITKKIKKIIAYSLSILFIFAVWEILSVIVNSPLILPSPLEVAGKIPQTVASYSFWLCLAATFLRVVLSFIISVAAGTILGILCANFSFFNDFLKIPLNILKATPVIAVILVALFWFNSKILPVFVSVLMTLPVILTQVKSGIQCTPKVYLFFADCHNFGFIKKVRYFQWPFAKNSFYEGSIQVFSTSWKVIVAGEVLCLPSYSLGKRLYNSQIHLESAELLCQVMILIIVSVITEFLLNIIYRKIINNTDNRKDD